jgi:hypothetical protein
MGAKDVWNAVASQRMGDPVLLGVLIGRKGAMAKQLRSGMVGQVAGAVGGVVGDVVENVAEQVVDKLGERTGKGGQKLPTRQATLLPIKDFAYLAMSNNKLGLFQFDRQALRAKNALKETIFIVNRTGVISLRQDKKGWLWKKFTLTVPGYLPTPIIVSGRPRFWKTLAAIAQEVNKS